MSKAKKEVLPSDPVKVNLVIGAKEGNNAALERIFDVMFPNDPRVEPKNGWCIIFDGIEVTAMDNRPKGRFSFYDTTVSGLKLKINGYNYRSVLRKVMVKCGIPRLDKEGTLDRADFLRKIEALKGEKIKADQATQKDKDKSVETARTRYKVITDAGYPLDKDRHWEHTIDGVFVHGKSPTSVSLDFYGCTPEEATKLLKLWKEIHPELVLSIGD